MKIIEETEKHFNLLQIFSMEMLSISTKYKFNKVSSCLAILPPFLVAAPSRVQKLQ